MDTGVGPNVGDKEDPWNCLLGSPLKDRVREHSPQILMGQTFGCIQGEGGGEVLSLDLEKADINTYVNKEMKAGGDISYEEKAPLGAAGGRHPQFLRA